MSRFSNGPVTVEQLTTDLGLSQNHLYDFAFGGATTGLGDLRDGGTQTKVGASGLPGMLLQVTGTLSSVAPIAPTSLFLVWGGVNDFRQQPPGSGSPAIAVSDILTIVAELQGAGAEHILVPGMPDLSLTPAYSAMPQPRLSARRSIRFWWEACRLGSPTSTPMISCTL